MSTPPWLKLLLPELHLVDIVRKYGWTRSSDRPQPIPAPVDMPAIPMPAMPMPAVTAHPADQLLATLSTSLLHALALRPWAVSPLLTSVGRWLTGGVAPNRPAGVIFLGGAPGSGKSYVAEKFTEVLRREEIIGSAPYEEIDLERYQGSDGAERLFRQRLLPAASTGRRRVYVFDRIDYGHPTVVQMLERLVRTGEARVGGQAISVENSFLLFMSSLGFGSDRDWKEIPPVLRDRFGMKFWEPVHDVVLMERPDAVLLQAIATEWAADFAEHFHQQSGVMVTFLPSATGALAADALARGRYVYSLAEVFEALPPAIAGLRGNGSIGPGPAEVTCEGSYYVRQGPRLLPLPVVRSAGRDPEAVLSELDRMVGLAPAKEFVRSLYHMISLARERRAMGMAGSFPGLHMRFEGNPATGKTTVARLVARALREMGVLHSGHLIEATRQDLVDSSLSVTVGNVRALVQKALGGVLFIDEADGLVRNERDLSGQEAVITLVKEMEEHREDLVVILAGYPDEIDRFLAVHPALRSHISNRIPFPDYTYSELVMILTDLVRHGGYELAPGAAEAAEAAFRQRQLPGRKDAGNGRLVHDLFEEAIGRQAERLSRQGFARRYGYEGSNHRELRLLLPEDLAPGPR